MDTFTGPPGRQTAAGSMARRPNPAKGGRRGTAARRQFRRGGGHGQGGRRRLGAPAGLASSEQGSRSTHAQGGQDQTFAELRELNRRRAQLIRNLRRIYGCGPRAAGELAIELASRVDPLPVLEELYMARKKGHWQSERCTVCSHSKIGIINFSLARGISPLAVAKQHGLGTSAVYNHNRAHIEENYRKIIGSGVYADIDELLKKCTQGDAESLDVLNAMISGFFHNWSLAFANGSQAGMVAYSAQLRQLIEVAGENKSRAGPGGNIR